MRRQPTAHLGRDVLLRVVAVGLALGPTAGCTASGRDASGRPTIVVTTTVLGAVVADAVRDRADVEVLIPNGADPHDWEPSARDIAAINHADLVVRNGLDLESGVLDALDRAARDGVRTFVASDHVGVRTASVNSGPAADDPHLWMDPLSVRDVIDALGPQLHAIGIDADDGIERVTAELTTLDDRIRDVLAVIPPDRRILVTGHDSLGYFAARYDFRLIGAIVPSLTTQAEVSAAHLSVLAAAIATDGVPVVFSEVGTPDAVARAIGEETGVPVVELATHALPADGQYSTFLLSDATTIAGALAPQEAR